MDEDIKKVLEQYVLTANSGKYESWEEINSKFPELKDYDSQLLEQYVATANSEEYDSWDAINAKFPEFDVKKKESTESSSTDISQDTGMDGTGGPELEQPTEIIEEPPVVELDTSPVIPVDRQTQINAHQDFYQKIEDDKEVKKLADEILYDEIKDLEGTTRASKTPEEFEKNKSKLISMKRTYFELDELESKGQQIEDLKTVINTSENDDEVRNARFRLEHLIPKYKETRILSDDKIAAEMFEYYIKNEPVKKSQYSEYVKSIEYREALDEGSSTGARTTDPDMMSFENKQSKENKSDYFMRPFLEMGLDLTRGAGNLPDILMETKYVTEAKFADLMGQDGIKNTALLNAQIHRLRQTDKWDAFEKMEEELSNEYVMDDDVIDMMQKGEFGAMAYYTTRDAVGSLPYTIAAVATAPLGVPASLATLAFLSAANERESYAEENALIQEEVDYLRSQGRNQEADNLEATKVSDEAALAGSYAKGVLEAGTEMIQVNILGKQLGNLSMMTKKYNRMIKAGKSTTQAGKALYKTNIKKQGTALINNTFQESSSEFVAGYSQAFVDAISKGEDFDHLQGIREGAIGAMAAVPMAGIPGGVNLIGSTLLYSKSRSLEERKNNEALANELMAELESETTTPEDKKVIAKQANSLVKDQQKLNEEDGSLHEKATEEQSKELAVIQGKMDELESTKEVVRNKKPLEEKQKELQAQKDQIIKEIEAAEEVKAIEAPKVEDEKAEVETEQKVEKEVVKETLDPEPKDESVKEGYGVTPIVPGHFTMLYNKTFGTKVFGPQKNDPRTNAVNKAMKEAKTYGEALEMLKKETKSEKGIILSEKQSEDLQKEIEDSYSDEVKFGPDNKDIRTNVFNLENPLAEKTINGKVVKIIDGLVRDGKKSFLLYVDGKVQGEFKSVDDAKKVVGAIEKNLIKPKKVEAKKPNTTEVKTSIGTFDITVDEQGEITEIRSKKSGKVISKERVRETKKIVNGKRVIKRGKNANYSKIVAEFRNEKTDNQINQEKKDKLRKITSEQPTNPYEAALFALANGAKANLSSITTQTGDKSNSWASKKEANLPGLEKLSEDIHADLTIDMDQTEIYRKLIEIINSHQSINTVIDEVIENYSEKTGTDYYNQGMDPDYIAQLEQAKEGLTEEEKIEYYEKQIDKQLDNLTEEQQQEFYDKNGQGTEGRSPKKSNKEKVTTENLLDFLDDAEARIKKFERNQLGSLTALGTIPLKIVIKAARAGIKAGQSLAEIIEAAKKAVANSDWYKALTALEQQMTLKQVEDFFKKPIRVVADVMPTSISEKNLMNSISKARLANFTDAEIKDHLLRVAKLKARLVKAALDVPFNQTEMVPPSFGNLEGGMETGLKLFMKLHKYLNKQIIENEAKTKDTGKVTKARLMDRVIEYMQKQPEYIAQADTYKRDGKIVAKKAVSSQQARMEAELSKILPSSPTKNLATKIKMAKKMADSKLKGAKELQDIKREIRSFLRKVLPTTEYSKKEALDLMQLIADATRDNIKSVIDKATALASEKNVQILNKQLLDILTGKYTTMQSGRIKGIKIDVEAKERIAQINSMVVNKTATEEQITEANEKLAKSIEKIEKEASLRQSIDSDAVSNMMIAMMINSSFLLPNTYMAKVDILTDVIENLEGIIETGKANLKAELEAAHKKYKEQFAYIYEDITGIEVDMDSPDFKKQLQKEVDKGKREKSKLSVQNRIKKAFARMSTLIEDVFTSAEALDGLMDKISSLPGEMFGGRTQELVTEKVDAASRMFKHRQMISSTLFKSKFQEFFGKGWAKEMVQARQPYRTGIVTNTAEVEAAIKKVNEAKTKKEKREATKELNDIKNELILSQNQMYYLYNQFKDPNNHASFEEMYGEDYKRVMDEMEAQLKPEIKQFADWQTDVFFPMVYDYYNKAYRKIYRTNMPQSELYGGRIYRSGVEVEQMDLLADQGFYNTSVGAASTKSRKDNNTRIEEMDGTDALLAYSHDMEYFAAFAETIRDINKLFTNPLIKQSIINIHGRDTMTLITDAIQKVANKGPRTDLTNRFINNMNTVFILSRLGLSPVVMIKQLTSLFTYANDIGIVNWTKYSVKSVPEAISTYKEIRDNSVYMQDRKSLGILQTIESYADDKAKDAIPARHKEFIVDLLMYTTTVGDAGAIYLGGMANYNYYKAQYRKKHPKANEQQVIDHAIIKFERDTKRTQQSSDLQDKDIFQTSSPLTRALNMFLTTPKQYLRKEIQATRSLFRKLKARDAKAGKGTVTQNVRTLLMYHVFMPVLFQWVAAGLPWMLRPGRDGDKEDLVRAGIIGNLNALIVLGEAVTMAGDFFTSKPWTGQTKSLGILNIAAELATKANRARNTKDPEKAAANWKKFYIALLQTTGMPASNIDKLIKNYSSLDEGDPGEIALKLMNFSDYAIYGPEEKVKKKTGIKLRKSEIEEFAPEMYESLEEIEDEELREEEKERREEKEELRQEMLEDIY